MNKRLIVFAAAGALAACSSAQSPTNTSALPQTQIAVQHNARWHSWMLKEAASETLVYVSENGEYNNPGVYVYSYPQGKQVGFLQENTGETFGGLCTDTHGDVWAPGWITNGQAFLTEWPHGGSQPLQDLITVGEPSGCSVDPKTGNLAIANYMDFNVGRRGDIAIYKNGSQKPTEYYDNSITYYYYCAYDAKGNLYADGNTNYINVLAKNSNTLRHVYFNKKIVPGSLQWNGSSLAVVVVGGNKGPVELDRATIQGSGAQITGTTNLQTKPSWGNYLNVQYWIQGKIVAGIGPGSGSPVRTVYFWAYPGGGKASMTIAGPNNGNFAGVAISP
jgi:hypothetical protein